MVSRVCASLDSEDDRDDLSCSPLFRGLAGSGGVFVASERPVLLRDRSRLVRSAVVLPLGSMIPDPPCEFLETTTGRFWPEISFATWPKTPCTPPSTALPPPAMPLPPWPRTLPPCPSTLMKPFPTFSRAAPPCTRTFLGCGAFARPVSFSRNFFIASLSARRSDFRASFRYISRSATRFALVCPFHAGSVTYFCANSGTPEITAMRRTDSCSDSKST